MMSSSAFNAPQQVQMTSSTSTAASPMMVHTPYSCEHDLVPSNSEVASQCIGSSLPKDSALGSPQCSRMSAAPSFDPWTGQYDGNEVPPQQQQYHSQQQQHRARGDSRISNHSGSSGSAPSSHVSSSRHSASYGQQRSPVPQVGDLSASRHQHPQQGSQQPFPAFMMRAPIVNAPVHSPYLGGKCEYLEIPQGSGAEITTAAQWNRSHKVFIGHVKFEISADGLRWIIYMLTGVQAGKVEVRGMGCFMVFFATAEDVFRVRGLHKRVLFDTQGIWFAQNLEQEQTLHSYASNVAHSVHAKLPKGLMVVDEETSRRRNRKHKSAADKKMQAGYGEEQGVQKQPAASSAICGGSNLITPSAAAVASQEESAQDLWAAGAQFNSNSRMGSAEDEYCS